MLPGICDHSKIVVGVIQTKQRPLLRRSDPVGLGRHFHRIPAHSDHAVVPDGDGLAAILGMNLQAILGEPAIVADQAASGAAGFWLALGELHTAHGSQSAIAPATMRAAARRNQAFFSMSVPPGSPGSSVGIVSSLVYS